jgi:hypothetical protein
MRRPLPLLIVVAVGVALGTAAPASALRTPVDQVPGTICDVTDAKILYLDRNLQLQIKDRGTGDLTPIPYVMDQYNNCGYVSPHGAVFDVSQYPDYGIRDLWEFRDGSLIPLGGLHSSYKVRGRWLIWSDPARALLRRDLDTGTTVTVASGVNTDNDVDKNGNVVYSSGSPEFDIYRFDGTTNTQLTSDSPRWNNQPLTDGVNVVYANITPCCGDEHGAVGLYTSGAAGVLDSERAQWTEPHYDYEAAGGWVAYTRIGTAGERQVWLRSPAGVGSRASPTGFNAQIEALSPQGEVIYTSWRTVYPNVGHYLSGPGGQARYLGDSGGPYQPSRFYWDGPTLYEISRGTIFRIDPNPGPYARPKGATPFRASLVPAYEQCTSSNSTHGAPLSFPSCRPAAPVSQYLTIGTPDSNGLAARSEGSLTVRAQPGDTATFADEADALIEFSYMGVLKKDLTDYTGELEPTIVIRRTDRENSLLRSGSVDHVDGSKWPLEFTTTADHGLRDGEKVDVQTGNCAAGRSYTVTVTGPRTFTLPECGSGYSETGGTWQQAGSPGPEAATGINFPLSFSVPCVATPGPTPGSDCTASTSADAIVPGTVKETNRSIWQFASARVFDGGADGDGDTTADNTLFATEGVFVP